MLRLEDLILRQGTFRLRANLAVEPGVRVAVIGPSGSGKSTLLAAIAGFLPLAQGRITWEGEDLGGQDPGERPMSILFQDDNLFPHLSVAKNIGLGLSPTLRGIDWERVTDSLASVGLAGMDARLPSELSGGQQSRVALARVLLRARPLLLLDEPFAALGPALRAEMLELVGRVADDTGATVLMVSHAPEDALRLGGQAITVIEGRAEPPVETKALLSDPPPGLREYLGSG